ncbi:MAG: FAD-binding domain-containing protein [Trueperaceae bacterium]
MILSHQTIDAATLAEQLKPYFSGDVYTSKRYEPTLAAAKKMLLEYRPAGYARTRNQVDGNVTWLNPYVTWGVFTLRELFNAVRPKANGQDLEKFVSELGWKAYFREGFLALGDRVYTSLEPYKYPTLVKQDSLPDTIKNAATGIEAIDSIVRELKETGHLHNHKRMWFAAYLVHYAKVEWWQGEKLFYHYLLDGEPGPNALSWQWVASTFSGKPYYFNGQNMAKNNHSGWKNTLLDDSYENLNTHYFAGRADGSYTKRPQEQPVSTGEPLFPDLVRAVKQKPLVILHAERLSDSAEVLKTVKHVPVVVMLDGARLKKEQPSFMRLHFVVNLAADVVKTLLEQGREAELVLADSPSEIADYAKTKGCESIATPDSWHPGTWLFLKLLDRQLPVSVVEDVPFARAQTSLRSFSSFWGKAERQVRWR